MKAHIQLSTGVALAIVATQTPSAACTIASAMLTTSILEVLSEDAF